MKKHRIIIWTKEKRKMTGLKQGDEVTIVSDVTGHSGERGQITDVYRSERRNKKVLYEVSIPEYLLEFYFREELEKVRPIVRLRERYKDGVKY